MLRVRWPRVAPRAVLALSTHFYYDKTNAHTVMCFGQGQIVNEWPTPRLETSDNLPWPWGWELEAHPGSCMAPIIVK